MSMINLMDKRKNSRWGLGRIEVCPECGNKGVRSASPIDEDGEHILSSRKPHTHWRVTFYHHATVHNLGWTGDEESACHFIEEK